MIDHSRTAPSVRIERRLRRSGAAAELVERIRYRRNGPCCCSRTRLSLSRRRRDLAAREARCWRCPSELDLRNELPDVVAEQVGLFVGREVPTAVEAGVANDLISALGVFPGR